MSGVICKLPNDNYLVWCVRSDEPLTYGVALPALEDYLRREEGERYMREDHAQRMRAVEMYGTSLRAPMPQSFERLIRGNRAGPNGEELTLEQIMEAFGQLPADYVEDDVALPNSNRCASCIEPKPDAFLADTGICGCCGQVADVWDPALIAFYAGLGLASDAFFDIPRLRSSWMPSAPVLTAKGEAEIWRRIGAAISNIEETQA